MSGGALIAATRPLYWAQGCKCRSAGYSLNATREIREDGRCVGPKGDRMAAPIARVVTIAGPSCDRCGAAWVNLQKGAA